MLHAEAGLGSLPAITLQQNNKRFGSDVMKFGIFYELQLPRPWEEGDELRLYQNALTQLETADQLGYDYAWVVEHHFLEEYSHSPSPESFLAAASQRTKQIRLGHGIFQLTTNHPARVAERVAVLDLLVQRPLRIRHGRERLDHRADAVRPRHGNQARGVRGGGAGDLPDVHARSAPSITANISTSRLRNVVPKPMQKPHPPLWMACSQLPTIERAGENGFGALGFQFVSAEAAHAWVHAYYNAITKRLKKLADYEINPNMALVSFFMCAKTDEEARARADGATFFQFALRYYGASQNRQRPGARHRQHVGRIQQVEARKSGGAGGGAARRPDRLAGNHPQETAAVPFLAYRPGDPAQPGRQEQPRAHLRIRWNCSPRK